MRPAWSVIAKLGFIQMLTVIFAHPKAISYQCSQYAIGK